jgi:hypothetical protein
VQTDLTTQNRYFIYVFFADTGAPGDRAESIPVSSTQENAEGALPEDAVATKEWIDMTRTLAADRNSSIAIEMGRSLVEHHVCDLFR